MSRLAFPGGVQFHAKQGAGVILNSAGKPGDRWALLRKELGREESPDTVIFAQAVATKVSAHCAETKGRRAW
jgi:hypothetical protein